MNTQRYLLFVLTAMAFIGCQTTKSPHGADEHNSQSSLDWQGSYIGIISCKTCSKPSINIHITLNDDNTYRKTVSGLESAEQTTHGKFVWSDDGSYVKLGENHYFVGENHLGVTSEGNCSSKAQIPKYCSLIKEN